MALESSIAPTEFASIRNFAWLERGRLARSEQPPLTEAAYAALRTAGFGSVVSLRGFREAAQPPDWGQYYVGLERELCRQAGLAFRHVDCTDNKAPSPAQLVAALAAIEREHQAGRPILVHCLAGMGRIGVVSGAWYMTQGGSGDVVAEAFFQFCDAVRLRRNPAADPAAYFKENGSHFQLWALHEVADALGQPITDYRHSEVLAPQKPPGVEGWDRAYGELLSVWRQNSTGGGIDPHTPRRQHGLRNFRWATERVLACGEYPLDESAWRQLNAAGFDTVVCLRAEREGQKAEWPRYQMAEQQQACEAAGLRMVHVPAEDYEALPPATVRDALIAIDEAVQSGGRAYVHCMAGVGRTGVVVNAWSITRGLASNSATTRFVEGARYRWAIAPRVEAWNGFVRRTRADEQLWELEAIAAALGQPTTVTFDDMRPRRPLVSSGWELMFSDVLRSWRETAHR